MKYRPDLPKEGWYVYGLFIKGTPFYIGKGSGHRATNHFSDSYKKSNPWKTNIIDKYQDDVEVIILSRHDREQEAFDTEAFLIKFYGMRGRGGILVNLTNGGGGTSGAIVTEEMKDKRGNGIRRFSKEAFKSALESYYLHGESQTQVAKSLGVHQSQFSQAILGKTRTLLKELELFKQEHPEIDFATYSTSRKIQSPLKSNENT